VYQKQTAKLTKSIINEKSNIMKTLTFKTNIHCDSCVQNVTPFLNRSAGEENWNVDINNPEKILSVSGENIDPEKIKSSLEEAGYKADPVP